MADERFEPPPTGSAQAAALELLLQRTGAPGALHRRDLIDHYESVHRYIYAACASLSSSAALIDDSDDPEQFALLDLVVTKAAQLAWRYFSTTAPVPPAPTAKDSLSIDHAAHRYPCCLVWTPMHPLTWIAPYAGHVGMCDRDGIVYDFAGRRVGRDKMSFGWPARYLQLPPEAAHANGGSGWTGEVLKAAVHFDQHIRYDLFTWNCHSMLASFLNNIHLEPTPLRGTSRRGGGGREGGGGGGDAAVGGPSSADASSSPAAPYELGPMGGGSRWTIFSVGLRLALHGTYVRGCNGELQQFGGFGVVTTLVLLLGALAGDWAPAWAWAWSVLLFNGALLLWFGLVAPSILRLDSQSGRVTGYDAPTLGEGAVARDVDGYVYGGTFGLLYADDDEDESSDDDLGPM